MEIFTIMDVKARYHPLQEQIDLADAFGDALGHLLPVARLHVAPAETDEIWNQLTELGLFGILKAEAEGGSGLGIVEEVLIATRLGRQLIAPSVVATLGAQGLSNLPDGARVAAAYVENGRPVAVDADGAQALLLRQEDSALLLPVDGKELQPIEQLLWLSHLHGAEGVDNPGGRLDARNLLRLRLLDAAVLAGIAACAQEMAVAYALIREQFGRPIGSFQAVKHSCANMAISARCARDQVNFAAVAMDADRTDAMLQVESALLVAIDAAIDNAGRNIQIHGGIGFSAEADPHLVLKRARIFATIAGGAEKALHRVACVPFTS